MLRRIIKYEYKNKCLHAPIYKSLNFIHKNVVTGICISSYIFIKSLTSYYNDINAYLFTSLTSKLNNRNIYLFTTCNPNCNDEMLKKCPWITEGHTTSNWAMFRFSWFSWFSFVLYSRNEIVLFINGKKIMTWLLMWFNKSIIHDKSLARVSKGEQVWGSTTCFSVHGFFLNGVLC